MATWTQMSTVPNPYTDSNGNPYSGAVLKVYDAGTSNTQSIAIAAAGTSPQATIAYNASGALEVSGNEVAPYIDRICKWGIFANATDAAANTPFAMGPFDNVPQSAGLSGVATISKDFATLALAVASTEIAGGDVATLKERESGKKRQGPIRSDEVRSGIGKKRKESRTIGK